MWARVYLGVLMAIGCVGCHRSPDPQTELDRAIDLYVRGSRYEFADPARAITYYQRVLEHTSPEEHIHYLSKIGIASSHVKLGHYEEAIDRLRQLMTDNPIDWQAGSDAQGSLDYLYKTYGEIDDVVSAYRRVSSRHPGEEAICFLALEKVLAIRRSYRRLLKELNTPR